jgi:hypothetical protein
MLPPFFSRVSAISREEFEEYYTVVDVRDTMLALREEPMSREIGSLD